MTKSKYNLNSAICRYMLINVNIKKNHTMTFGIEILWTLPHF
jgi:hypothetical protein